MSLVTLIIAIALCTLLPFALVYAAIALSSRISRMEEQQQERHD